MREHEEAMETLEIFLGTALDDDRRGAAFIMLGRTYLTLGKIVEAESGILSGRFAIGADATASGGQFVSVPSGSGASGSMAQ